MPDRQNGHEAFSDALKVVFPLVQDQDGYPPFTEEALWVRAISEDAGEVMSVPFFVVGLSKGDIIRFDRHGGEGRFAEMLAARGHSTLRIFLRTATRADLEAVLPPSGVALEQSPMRSLIAIDLEPDFHYPDLRSALLAGEASGMWEFEESCLAREHR